MARLRMDGVADDALIPTPPAGKATIFYNSTDRTYKAKLDDGTVVTMSADAEGPVTSVNGQTGVVTLSKSDIGLANVDNTSDANKPISNATQLALNAKYDASNPANYVDAAAAAAAAPVQLVAGKTGAVLLDKSDVGLSNVDNTSDANKPVSNATQLALDELGGRVFTVEGEVAGLDSAVSGLDSRLTSAEGSISSLQSDVSSIQGEVSTIEGAISSLETSVAGKLSLSGGSMTGNINMESSGGSGPVTLFGMFLGNSGGLSTYAFTPMAPNTMDAPFQLLDGSDVVIGDILFAPAMFELRYYAAPGSSIPDVAGINTMPIFAESTGTGIIQLQIQFSDTYMPMMPLKLQYVGAGAATNYKVVGLADAVNARDAVNKQQLDAAISAITVPVTSVAGKTGAVVLEKADVGLSAVDNTADLDKPISTATQTALDGKLSLSGGLLTGPLDMDYNFIDNIPGPVSDNQPATKYYVDQAIAGAGQVASVNGQTGVVVLAKADVGLGSADNTADLDKPISTATQSALDDLTIATQDNASSLDDLTVYAQDIRTDLDLFIAPSGATRPASPVVGQIFFDTVLVKPIFYSGSAWVDATGAVV